KNGKAEPVGYITVKQEMQCTLGKSPAINAAKMHYDFEGVGVAGVSQNYMNKLGNIVAGMPGMHRV
ncbi:MAG: hypothetical protein J5861_03095, partial [Desulfovibrio sp.]|nr:hypothetical protein [Desulfovibrio sp.]